jgi:(p)ppGpp synthase/HD superfamily hydrolase
VPPELIAREFGDRVADLVREVTDGKKLFKDVRKENQVKTDRMKRQIG